MLFPTSLVGSYPQPDWLIDREKLAGRFPPRVRALELWRVDPAYLEEAQQDATLLAIRAQEDAGLDVITDGEIRRESYSNRFATALDGVDIDNPGTALDRSGHPNPVPRIVGPIRRRHPVQVDDLKFLRAHTDRTVKVTVPGPFTMSQQAQNDYYPSREEAAFGYAEAVNEEVKDLFAAGADIVQLDEPYLQARPDTAKEYGVRVLNAALDGITGTTVVLAAAPATASVDVRGGAPGARETELLGADALVAFAPAETPVLWPEHFDVAIRVQDATFGVSPGDGFIEEPYAYVGVSRPPAGDAFWNAPFGAAVPLGAADDGGRDVGGLARPRLRPRPAVGGHQLGQRGCHAAVVPAGLGDRAGERVPGKRGDHEVEGWRSRLGRGGQRAGHGQEVGR